MALIAILHHGTYLKTLIWILHTWKRSSSLSSIFLIACTSLQTFELNWSKGYLHSRSYWSGSRALRKLIERLPIGMSM